MNSLTAMQDDDVACKIRLLCSPMAKQRRRLAFPLVFASGCFLVLSLVFLTSNSLTVIPFSDVKLKPVASVSALHFEQVPSFVSSRSDSSPPPPPPPLPPLSTIINCRSYPFSVRAKAFFGRNPTCRTRFLMTWVSKLGTFGPREILSVESVFKFHPQACLLILSSAMDSPTGARLLKPLTSRGFRLAAMDPDFGYLLKNTPAKRWYTSLRQGRLKPGNVPLGQNLSNLLRLAALYKFGGVYVDTDVIVLKDFSSLQNVIGAQSVDSSGNWSRLNNAVMVFEKRHPLVYEFLREFAATFNGSRWGHNGPYLVSRVVERMRGWSGLDFAVVPPPAFYPVSWNGIEEFFETPADRRHQSRVEAMLERIRRESFAVHLWNRVSRSMKAQERSLMERIFADCCLLCNSSSSSEKSVFRTEYRFKY